ncbi:solute carrier family 44 protein member 2 [Reticulomyxa filosa]|uniref:Choline transporter-like protein n=1 Tax=Reticulomyxa filosa TaxID=46433 RepID=X6NYL1_RETFI|nr:solute carrier family 44 protein member 2 [Reticulomyxa filosa]|eukprot:ETO30919.1 solute carrier family 44 protein member 2 [Reticulomyxa filosa]
MSKCFHGYSENNKQTNRACTDLPWCGVFFGFVVFLLAGVWIPAFSKGDVNRLINGVDFANRICGKSDGVRDKPLAYWPAPTESYRFKVCTNDCNVTLNSDYVDTQYPTKEYYGRYCLPTKASSVSITGYDTISNQFSRQFSDVENSLTIIGLSIPIAAVMAFVYIWLMKQCVGFLVCLSSHTLLFHLKTKEQKIFYYPFSSFFKHRIPKFQKEARLRQKHNNKKKVRANNLSKTGDVNAAKVQQTIGYAFATFTFIFTILIIFARNRIRIAVAVIRSASRAIGDMPLVVFFPIWPLVVLVGVFLGWIYAAVFIFSTSRLSEHTSPSGLTLCSAFLFLLWVTQILVYFTFTAVAGAIANWYFTERDTNGKKLRGSSPQQLPNNAVTLACWRTLRYHMGTIFFASFVIAAIQFMRWVVRYLERMTNGGKKPNKLQKIIFRMVDCLLWCLECCLDKVSRNALIFTAIYGDAFCPAVCDSFALVWANLVRVAAITFFSTIVTVLGKVFVPLVTVAICGISLIYAEPFKSDVTSPIWPCVFVLIFGTCIGMLFIVVYDTAIDTIFICFLIDEKYNKTNGKMLADDDLRTIVQHFEQDSQKLAESVQRNHTGNANTVQEEKHIPPTGVEI